jgi:hypothetical protein
MTKNAEHENDCYAIKATKGDKYATSDSTRGRIDNGPLRADHRGLFMLCWPAWTSDVLITLLLLNGYDASRKLSSEALVPLLPWLRPRSANHHLGVIHN